MNINYEFVKNNELLESSEVHYWLNFGSVLSSVRNKGKIIEHDNDIDIGIWSEDINKIKTLVEKIEKDGYRVVLQKGLHVLEDFIQIYEPNSKSKSFHIDIYIFRQKDNMAFCRNIHSPVSKLGKFFLISLKIINVKLKENFLKISFNNHIFHL